MKVNTCALEVFIVAGSYSYKLGDLVWQEDLSVLWCLPCCFLLLAFTRLWVPFPADMKDHSERQ
jgi:hypothetical protein